ncbi:GNAT family N-acetyltransferase [Streptomyces sp. RPT161]|uniref:GNAT family N-acetyltransferase n=1 Tax=Streptomyces sp. RPT161 TaxID=3015993 RepID=UPI0022B8DF68|nr:GNAT family N-acetyltransferase [Streptomyces sp. RPT161]
MNATNELYRICAETPSVETYLRLRLEAGMSAKSPEAARIGLPNSWHAVTVFRGDEPVGMGRIIGDGGCVFQIVDIAVARGHQGRGLGKQIMTELVRALEQHAPDKAYVSLIADGDARFLYEKFGFRPTAPASIGMYRVMT